jgi:hypothetical protein
MSFRNSASPTRTVGDWLAAEPEPQAVKVAKTIITSRPITANAVMTLLSKAFMYEEEAVQDAIRDANAQMWYPHQVGLRATVTRVKDTPHRYTVAIVDPDA